MNFNTDPDWLREKAAREDGCFVSVGGSLTDYLGESVPFDELRHPQLHFVSPHCTGEICGMCWREKQEKKATHKIGEELSMGHNLTQYVCCEHFAMIVGPESAKRWRGCSL